MANIYTTDGGSGPVQIGSKTTGGIYSSSTSQEAPVGHRLAFSDDRVFRYGQFAASTNMALLTAQDVSATCQAEADNNVVAPASAQTTTDGTAGYKHVEVTAAGVTANQYAEGIFHVTDGTGIGYAYKIRSNTATGDPASGNYRIEFYDEIQTSMDGTTDYAITGCMWKELRGASSTDDLVSGVTMVTQAEDDYGWVQTWGRATVLADASGGAINAGDICTLSDGTTGAFQLQDAYTEPVIGFALFAPDDTTKGGVFLQICP